MKEFNLLAVLLSVTFMVSFRKQSCSRGQWCSPCSTLNPTEPVLWDSTLMTTGTWAPSLGWSWRYAAKGTTRCTSWTYGTMDRGRMRLHMKPSMRLVMCIPIGNITIFSSREWSQQNDFQNSLFQHPPQHTHSFTCQLSCKCLYNLNPYDQAKTAPCHVFRLVACTKFQMLVLNKTRLKP